MLHGTLENLDCLRHAQTTAPFACGLHHHPVLWLPTHRCVHLASRCVLLAPISIPPANMYSSSPLSSRELRDGSFSQPISNFMLLFQRRLAFSCTVILNVL